MSPDDVIARIRTILHEDFQVAPEKVTPAATIRGTLGLDSLDAVDLIYLLGREFELKTSVESFEGLHTVQGVAEYVVRTKAEQSAGAGA